MSACLFFSASSRVLFDNTFGGWAVASVVHLDAVGESGPEANLRACVPEILASDPVQSWNRWSDRRCERSGVFARVEGLNRSDS